MSAAFTFALICMIPALLEKLYKWFIETKNYNPNDPLDPINIEKSRRIHRGH